MGRSQRHRIQEHGYTSTGEINAEGEVSSSSGFIVDASDLNEIADNPNIVGNQVPVGPSGGPLSGSTMGGAIPVSGSIPTLVSLAPSTVEVTDEPGDLVVTGTKFAVGASIRINGEALTTVRNSATQVTAEVDWAELGTGTHTVTVVSAGLESNAGYLVVTEPEE